MNRNKPRILGLHLCLTKIINKNNCEQLVLKMSGCYPSIYLSSFSVWRTWKPWTDPANLL